MIELRREAGSSRPPSAMLFERRLAADLFSIVVALRLCRASGSERESDPPTRDAWGTRSTQLSI
jgi:hypothetical protein